MTRYKTTMFVDHPVTLDSVELAVEFDLLAGRPATLEQPAEDDELEIVSVTAGGEPFAMSDEEKEALELELMENLADHVTFPEDEPSSWPE